MDGWEKLKILSGVASVIVIPIVLLVIGNDFSAATKERELQGKYVELAAGILREAPSPETANLRSWATEVINQYSGVPLSPQTRKDLIETTVLPSVTERPRPGRWGVIYGADSDLDAARYEVERAVPLVGIDNAAIYFRAGSYRSVAVYEGRSEADEALLKARKRRADAYIVNMANWCPTSVAHEGYFNCDGRLNVDADGPPSAGESEP